MTGTSATSTSPSTVMSAVASAFVRSLVAVTSNSRVIAAETSRSCSSTRRCTFVDSGGNCSPSSSFGWYVREMPDSSGALPSSRPASPSARTAFALTLFSIAMIWFNLVTEQPSLSGPTLGLIFKLVRW